MSHPAKFGEISNAKFSGPDRTKFVTETETPGGSYMNCHIITYKETDQEGEATRARD